MTDPSRKGHYVGTPAIFKLELACKPINLAFEGFGCYLVGSALERPDWRDIDVRYIMDDDAFFREFPAVDRVAGTWEFDPKWILVCTGIADYLRNASGLPVDFQIQTQTSAKVHKGKRRHPLGLTLAPPAADAAEANMESLLEIIDLWKSEAEAAEARIKVLEEALRPFAQFAVPYDYAADDEIVCLDIRPTGGQLRRAREALKGDEL